MFATLAALFFTVILMVTTAYFLMGGLPLLILKHDTALDARFVRGFFDVYYKAAFVAATGAAVSFALCSRPAFAMGNAGVAMLVVLLRSRLITAMAQLGGLIQQGEVQAVRRFKRVHGTALAMNLVQLIGLVWGLTQISL
jgi:hypothetical protein